MNRLSLDKRAHAINLLVRGNTVRDTAELAGISFNACLKLVVDVGLACQKFQDEMVQNINAKRIQLDETHGFVYARRKNASKTGNPEAGDAWLWLAMDADTRLILCWQVGKRTEAIAKEFALEVKSRIVNQRIQLTTDGLPAYRNAIYGAFWQNIDFAQLEKKYGKRVNEDGEVIDKRIQYIGADKTVVTGNPDDKHISTSYIERQNLTLRMKSKRFTRKTNAFSKKLLNHQCAIALHYVYYNFGRIHQTLRVTPAMQAGLMDRWLEPKDIASLVDRYQIKK